VRAAVKIVGKAIKHRVYLFVALVATCTLAAGLVATIKPPTYQATALLTIDERFDPSKAAGTSIADSESLSDQFIQTAASYPVLQRACSGTYFDTATTAGVICDAATLTPHVTASAVNGPDWIAVNVTWGSAAEAAALADAVARALIDQNKADIHRLIAPSRDSLNAEIQTLEAGIHTEQATIAQLETQTSPDAQSAIAAEQAKLVQLQNQELATNSKVQDLVIQENWLAGSLTFDQAAVPPATPIDPDPVHRSRLVQQVVNKVMLDGKKSTAERIVYDALAILAEKSGKDPVEALEESIKILTPSLEVRSRRVGGATYQVPVEVPTRRARTLAVRWLVEFSRSRREKQMSARLAGELLDAQSQQGGAYKRKDDIFRMAQANKAFAHYRW